ncbi:MAG TPA: hypothetical protein VHC43_00495 [Mycobacteriales bacterium]|nr:hypothetical protein [Mycobacteriales bacterium]
MNYQEAIRFGAAEYADVIQALWQAGYRTSFTQTGGMCAALEVRLETGASLLITDADDTLSWDRIDHRGWAVGMYPPENEYDGEALAFRQTDRSDIDGLLSLISYVLAAA